MRVALIQMSVTADKEKNIAAACQYIRQAAEHGGGHGGSAGDVLLPL